MKKPHSCFVIMPFCDTKHGPKGHERKISEAQWTHIYDQWIKPAVESYKLAKFICKRSPRKPGSIIKGIVADLANADLVVADLTGSRPNVYYELGVRHALRVGTIIISQDFSALPSDLSNYFVFGYDYSEKTHEYEDYYARFQKRMHETIRAWDETDDPCDNPVSDFLGITDQLREKKLEEEKQELKTIYSKLKKHFAHNFKVCEDLLRLMETQQPVKSRTALIVDVFPIETLFSRLVNYDWKQLSGFKFETLEDLVIDQRRLFNEVAVTMRTLEMNPQERDYYGHYFLGLLKQIHAVKKHFEENWDTLAKAIDTIKMVKSPKPRRYKP